MELLNYDMVVEMARKLPKKGMVAVASAADAHVIEATLEAREKGVAEPIYVGDAEKIRAILREMGLNPSDFNIENTAAGMNDAETAVELVKNGSASFLMKGMLETSDMLRPVVKKENNLRTGRAMSHLSFNKFDAYHKVICSTDGGMNTYPDLERKKDILHNAIDAFHKLGYELPKAGILCCKETYDEKIKDTVEARRLQEMAEAGEFGKCAVVGPISYDIAFNAEIAKIKHFDCPYCGNFDIVMGPDIHSNNLFSKVWVQHCGAVMAGMIVGAKVPIVLSSRGASAQEKYLSLTLASVIASAC